MATSKKSISVRIYYSLDSKELKPYLKKYPRAMVHIADKVEILNYEEEISINSLYEKYKGKDAYLLRETYYDDTTIYVVVNENRLETDEEYAHRLNTLYSINNDKKTEKKEREEREKQEYLRLKKKFESS